MEQQVVKRASYHIQVYDILKDQILSRKLSSGEKINENALAQSLGVSRSPVREALRMLEQDELVVQSANGLIVNPLNVEDMKDVYECRMVLESYAASLGAATMTEETLARLENYVHQSMVCHRTGDMDKVVEVNTAFHNEIIASCKNTHLKNLVKRINALSILARVQEFSGYKRTPEYLDEHAAIVEAMKQRDVDKVEMLMRNHIRGDMMFYLSQINT